MSFHSVFNIKYFTLDKILKFSDNNGNNNGNNNVKNRGIYTEPNFKIKQTRVLFFVFYTSFYPK